MTRHSTCHPERGEGFRELIRGFVLVCADPQGGCFSKTLSAPPRSRRVGLFTVFVKLGFRTLVLSAVYPGREFVLSRRGGIRATEYDVCTSTGMVLHNGALVLAPCCSPSCLLCWCSDQLLVYSKVRSVPMWPPSLSLETGHLSLEGVPSVVLTIRLVADLQS